MRTTDRQRPLHALWTAHAHRVHAALAAALDGTGPALLPLPIGLPKSRIDALLAVLRPAALHTDHGVTALDGGVPVDAETAVVVATSGSTGTPKGVELTADALTASARASLARIGATDDRRWLCCLPTGHIAGLQVLVRAAVAGTTPILHDGFDVAAVAASDAGYVSLVPTQVRRLLDAGVDLSRFTIVLGAAAAPPDLLTAARAAGARVYTTYGMTETCGGCVYDGVPLDGAEVRVLAGTPGDVVGRIALRGPMLLRGYRLDPGLTADAVRDGWYRTADLGRWDGGRLHVLGRVDDVINTGGEKVVAGGVAGELTRHPKVRDAAVVGRPHREWGEVVAAAVVPVDPADPPSLAELRDWVKGALGPAAAPRLLDVVAEIPLLSSGKPDRERVRKLPGAFTL